MRLRSVGSTPAEPQLRGSTSGSCCSDRPMLRKCRRGIAPGWISGSCQSSRRETICKLQGEVVGHCARMVPRTDWVPCTGCRCKQGCGSHLALLPVTHRRRFGKAPGTPHSVGMPMRALLSTWQAIFSTSSRSSLASCGGREVGWLVVGMHCNGHVNAWAAVALPTTERHPPGLASGSRSVTLATAPPAASLALLPLCASPETACESQLIVSVL